VQKSVERHTKPPTTSARKFWLTKPKANHLLEDWLPQEPAQGETAVE
jgi:hypothetical protein